jgi:hypothetical protein
VRHLPQGAVDRRVRRRRGHLPRLPDRPLGAGAQEGRSGDPHGPARPAKAAAAAPVAPRQPLLGTVGNGDLEVRERRARRAALEALAESHPEEFGLLLRDARAKEKLRPLSTETVAAPEAAAPQAPAHDGQPVPTVHES